MPAIAGSNGAVEPLDSYEEDDFEEASGATLSDLFPNPETPNPEDMIEEICVEENDEELLWKCPPPVVRLHHADVLGCRFGSVSFASHVMDHIDREDATTETMFFV